MKKNRALRVAFALLTGLFVLGGCSGDNAALETETNANTSFVVLGMGNITVHENARLESKLTINVIESSSPLTIEISELKSTVTFPELEINKISDSSNTYKITFLSPDIVASDIVSVIATITFKVNVAKEPGRISTFIVKVLNSSTSKDSSSSIALDEKDAVLLDSNDYFDIDNIQSYAWSASTGQLSRSSSMTTEFTAPSVAQDSTVSVTLTVKADNGVSHSVTIPLFIRNKPPTAAISLVHSSNTLREGDVLLLDAKNSIDSDGTLMSYAWSASTGQFSRSSSMTTEFTAPSVAEDSTVLVTLTVTDSDGDSHSVTIPLFIRNKPPTAVISLVNSNNTLREGDVLLLDAKNSLDSDGTLMSYAWSASTGQLSRSSSMTTEFTAPSVAEDSTVLVTLTVTDSDGDSHSVTTTLRVINNQSPTAAISLVNSSNTLREGDVLLLDAKNSLDSDGTLMSYAWSASTGQLSRSSSITTEFTAPSVAEDSTVLVTLTVTDSDGDSHSVTTTLRVINNQSPTAAISLVNSSNTLREGDVLLLDAKNSLDSDGTLMSYAWSASTGQLSRNSSITTEFTAPSVAEDSTVLVTLTVTDSDGDSHSVTTTLRVINNQSPTAAISLVNSNNTLRERGVLSLDAKKSIDSDGIFLSYAWSASTGQLSRNSSITTEFTAPSVAQDSTVLVTLTVRDSDGDEHSMTTALRVINNQLPVVLAESLGEVSVGGMVELNASNSYDVDGEIERYSWSVSAGLFNSAAISQPIYTPPLVSTRTKLLFTLNVYDNDGDVNSTTIDMVIIPNQKPVAIAGSDYVLGETDSIQLDGSNSFDPDLNESITTFKWQVGSGTLDSSTASKPNYTASSVSEDTLIEVSLSVTDKMGNVGIATTTIKVLNNHTPVADIDSSNTIKEDEILTVSADNSTDSDGVIKHYLWTAPLGVFSSPNQSTSYYMPPTVLTTTTLVVTLKVTDDNGESDITTKAINITNVDLAPIIHIQGYNVDENSQTLIQANIDFPATSRTVFIQEYQWEVQQANGLVIGMSDSTLNSTVIHTPNLAVGSASASFLLVLNTTDNQGQTAKGSSLITIINNQAPSVTIDVPAILVENSTYAITLGHAEDSDGSIEQYAWSVSTGTLNDPTIANPILTIPYFNEDTTITLTLEVTDNDGDTVIDYIVVTAVNTFKRDLRLTGGNIDNPGNGSLAEINVDLVLEGEVVIGGVSTQISVVYEILSNYEEYMLFPKFADKVNEKYSNLIKVGYCREIVFENLCLPKKLLVSASSYLNFVWLSSEVEASTLNLVYKKKSTEKFWHHNKTIDETLLSLYYSQETMLEFGDKIVLNLFSPEFSTQTINVTISTQGYNLDDSMLLENGVKQFVVHKMISDAINAANIDKVRAGNCVFQGKVVCPIDSFSSVYDEKNHIWSQTTLTVSAYVLAKDSNERHANSVAEKFTIPKTEWKKQGSINAYDEGIFNLSANETLNIGDTIRMIFTGENFTYTEVRLTLKPDTIGLFRSEKSATSVVIWPALIANEVNKLNKSDLRIGECVENGIFANSCPKNGTISPLISGYRNRIWSPTTITVTVQHSAAIEDATSTSAEANSLEQEETITNYPLSSQSNQPVVDNEKSENSALKTTLSAVGVLQHSTVTLMYSAQGEYVDYFDIYRSSRTEYTETAGINRHSNSSLIAQPQISAEKQYIDTLSSSQTRYWIAACQTEKKVCTSLKEVPIIIYKPLHNSTETKLFTAEDVNEPFLIDITSMAEIGEIENIALEVEVGRYATPINIAIQLLDQSLTQSPTERTDGKYYLSIDSTNLDESVYSILQNDSRLIFNLTLEINQLQYAIQWQVQIGSLR